MLPVAVRLPFVFPDQEEFEQIAQELQRYILERTR